MKTIFDIGSNNGDDIPYYLLKSERVVAFEANDVLCRSIENRFPNELSSGRLIVESGIICAEKDAMKTRSDFYVHKHFDVLSQLPKPASDEAHLFTKIELPVRTLSSVISKYGVPYYAKIDIEHYDHVILAEFFRLEAFPTYISAEGHSQNVLSLLFRCPAYKGFTLVEGATVHTKYRNMEIMSAAGGNVTYSFPLHSAGPFGEDIAGPWYDRKSFFRRMLVERFGWKDLHASCRDAGERIDVQVSFSDYAANARSRIRRCLPTSAQRIYRRIMSTGQ